MSAVYLFWMETMTNQSANSTLFSDQVDPNSHTLHKSFGHLFKLNPLLVPCWIIGPLRRDCKITKSSLMKEMNLKWLPQSHSGRSSQVSTSVESPTHWSLPKNGPTLQARDLGNCACACRNSGPGSRSWPTGLSALGPLWPLLPDRRICVDITIISRLFCQTLTVLHSL